METTYWTFLFKVFLSTVEQELVKHIETPLRYSSLSSEEWRAMRSQL